jgi:hypothetical protein
VCFFYGWYPASIFPVLSEEPLQQNIQPFMRKQSLSLFPEKAAAWLHLWI